MSGVNSKSHANAEPTRIQTPATRVRVAGAAVGVGATVVKPESGGPQPGGGTKPATTVAVGTVLKQRFELVELLGSGGMGQVFRARDLRQVEAGDAEPWLAVKVIHENFSTRELALLSLQQETKKTQRLAHPNIVNVHDFDRDGDVAFMTMELLAGDPLDRLLRQWPRGLPVHRAMAVLRQVTDAVLYAHQQGVVHADLKPANIFVTRTGRVKVLDFGIARAIQQGGGDGPGPVLAGMTPAYTSKAVLEGAAPEPRDDLYALGCVGYYLFGGRHPYGRREATEAAAAELRPTRLSMLSRGQWRALRRLLALRPEPGLNASAFRRAFFDAGRRRQQRWLMAIAITALAILAGSFTINWLAHREHREVTALLAAKQPAQIAAGLRRLPQFATADQALIVQGAREQVLKNLRQRVVSLKAAEDYQLAQRVLALLQPLYPDSSTLQQLQQAFQTARNQYLQAVTAELQSRLQASRFNGGEPDFRTLVEQLRVIEPAHPLLKGNTLSQTLARAANLALYLGDGPQAERIVALAQSLFPDERERYKDILTRVYDEQGARPASPRPDGDQDYGAMSQYNQVVSWVEANDLATVADVERLLQASHPAQPLMYEAINASLARHVGNLQNPGSRWLRLQQQWASRDEPKAAPVPKDPCGRHLANRGASPQYRCRDSLTASLWGPELVVVKGAKGTPSFAVSRTEISVNDFNHYCRLYRACSPRSEPQQPLSNISYSRARAYVTWLSEMTGHQYALPSLAQWRLMARDDSGVRDHNCKLMAGGRLIRGQQLRPAAEGYANSLGLLNLLGNVGEWVRTEAGLRSAGGDAGTPIQQCQPQNLAPASPDPAPLQGFRVVRKIG